MTRTPSSSRGAVLDRLDRLVRARPPRAASLIVSVFGDAVVPHGGGVALGTLIRWLSPFGIAERAVRTAMQRLAADDWFRSQTVGRRADVHLTETSGHRFEDAERRIYALRPEPWDESWTVVVLGPGSVETARRDAARRELRWHGFGELAPTVLVHPRADLEELALALRDLGLEREAIVLRAEGESRIGTHAAPLRSLAPAAWDLRDLEAAYDEYRRRFDPLHAALERGAECDDDVAFRVRVYAIHEVRRILLRDPELPAALLPPGWIGDEARELCAAIYRLVEAPARRFLAATGETASGRFPSPSPDYFRRFGGLRRTQADGAAPASIGERGRKRGQTYFPRPEK